nr:MAG TPA: hypothetical protein [Crassvirales sp.]
MNLLFLFLLYQLNNPPLIYATPAPINAPQGPAAEPT